jgi:hypothetical protein
VQIASKAGDIAAMPDGGQNRLIIFAGDGMAPTRSEANWKALFVATKFEEEYAQGMALTFVGI